MLTWSTACPTGVNASSQGKSLLPCGPLFPEEAEAALAVFRDLPIVDVLGKPTFGEISRDWVFDLPTAVFGAYNPRPSGARSTSSSS
jgi:phage terminase large subunit-like protein